MITAETQIRVRYAETDAMGVVYHANYLAWFEMARIEMLDKMGIPYKSLEEEGYLLPVLDAQLAYKSPARFDDRLTIEAKITEPPRMKIAIEYAVRRDDTLLCTGKTVHAFLTKNLLPTRPPKRFVELAKGYFA